MSAEEFEALLPAERVFVQWLAKAWLEEHRRKEPTTDGEQA